MYVLALLPYSVGLRSLEHSGDSSSDVLELQLSESHTYPVTSGVPELELLSPGVQS